MISAVNKTQTRETNNRLVSCETKGRFVRSQPLSHNVTHWRQLQQGLTYGGRKATTFGRLQVSIFVKWSSAKSGPYDWAVQTDSDEWIDVFFLVFFLKKKSRTKRRTSHVAKEGKEGRIRKNQFQRHQSPRQTNFRPTCWRGETFFL